ncbi:MAG TPA: hypothetical protein VMZ91_16190, partial [Candidatus Paceibacterota bacterium]|nr:hypothetical protein [Candidatus Paceibacterota bacterium]
RNLRQCFIEAEKEEKKGNKHKGLIITLPDVEAAKSYIKKAKESLELCEIYKERRIDYKIPEEWFYALYYCALAILSKFGIESRSQKYTAQFLEYIKLKGLIDYEDELIEMITVHKERDKESEVDKREEARYSPAITFDEVFARYEEMTNLCKKAISQSEEIVFSDKKFDIPKELF